MRIPFGLALVALAACTRAALPDVVSRELARAPKGTLTVVEFLDFECIYCRHTYAALAPALARHKGHVRVVRKHVPLMTIHPSALSLARASVCGEAQGKGDETADAIMNNDEFPSGREGFTAFASSLGLDTTAFIACMQAESTDDRIKSDMAGYKTLGAPGVPVVFIGHQRFDGEQSAEVFDRAVDDEF